MAVSNDDQVVADLFNTQVPEEVEETEIEEEEDTEEIEEEEEVEEEEEEEEEEEDKPKKGDPSIALRQAREKERSAKQESEQYRKMLMDPGFLAQQMERLQGEAPKKGDKAPTQSQIDFEAPYYSTNVQGQVRKEMDMRQAVNILPDLTSDDDLADMVMGQVARGKSFTQAADTVKDRLGSVEGEARKKGALTKEQQIARKNNANTSAQPRSGQPGIKQQVDKMITSSSRSEREKGIATALGF